MEVSMEDFNKLDLRVCTVLSAERIPGMKKILKVKVDLGGETRELVVGGAEYYPPEYFIGKKFIILANLQPKKIAGIESRGMLLAADVNGKPIWLTIDGDAPAGAKVR
ncbi:MAG: tRNA-binding protein [Candidatus Methanomethylicota archaeon]|uniref:tRNA-binding protein n=1 Tax=Thermoproteota archaeon TaxID=2056631 RepID=A0A497ESB0_9CREN|nr:MAG: tRNA-binding protein [Candidatus Verstraetearchaeota archaeon]RLE51427.1 MAG: tRNA-binding protein [Candidatus Verstraetearchaeota archaeon]